ncbi:MAG: hypothetical protein ABJC36_04920 [Gemmatimonadales bacterium]
MMRRKSFAVAAVVAVALGCADTNAPLPDPQEVLLAVNSTANTLSIVPVDAPNSAVQVPLGGTTPTPTGVSAREGVAIVPLGLDNAVVVVDLRTASIIRTIPLPANSGATGSAIVDDSIAYVGNPNINSVSRINYLTGANSEVPVGVYPSGLVFTRGKVFVLNGNLDETFSPAGPSWLTVVDPATNAVASGVDSIPLTGDGNAAFAAVGSDGLLYVMSTGNYFSGEGRLSVVDPLARAEVASFAGFGTGPGNVAADADARVFVSSYNEGVMEFNLDSNKVVRGAGQGVPVPSNATVAVDSKGRVYGIETGPCSGGQPGKAHVLDASLIDTGTIELGECPVGSTVVQIPPE